MSKEQIQHLDWDTKNFGYKVARIDAPNLNFDDLGKIIKGLAGEKVRLAYCFIDPADEVSNKAARDCGGLLVDEKVTYVREIPFKIGQVEVKEICSYLNEPLNAQLILLSLEAGVYSRYRVDPGFNNGEFEKLYTEWVRKSLSGEIARDVLVYKTAGKEVGFVTLGDKNGRCNLGLVATDPQHRRNSVGRKLVQVALERASDWGYKEMDVVTQGANVDACNFYKALSFKLESTTNIYHFWL